MNFVLLGEVQFPCIRVTPLTQDMIYIVGAGVFMQPDNQILVIERHTQLFRDSWPFDCLEMLHIDKMLLLLSRILLADIILSSKWVWHARSPPSYNNS